MRSKTFSFLLILLDQLLLNLTYLLTSIDNSISGVGVGDGDERGAAISPESDSIPGVTRTFFICSTDQKFHVFFLACSDFYCLSVIFEYISRMLHISCAACMSYKQHS
jgi:hypothetical protein